MNEITKAQWQWNRNKTNIRVGLYHNGYLQLLGQRLPKKKFEEGVKGAVYSSWSWRIT